MSGTVVALVLVAVLVTVATWARWSGRRVLGFVLGGTAVLPALVAVRDLPGPLINGLLIVAMLGVATVTVWPLLRGRRFGDRTTHGGGV